MSKLLSACVVTLALLLSAPAIAAEIPKELQRVMDLRHPTPDVYVAGQPEPDAFAAFAKAGVKHVINLRPPQETPELNEAAIVTKAGMAYYNIPIRDARDLTLDNVRLLDALLRRIGNDKVLIHCSSSNRVGALMALRAAWIEHASSEEAIEVGKRYGLTKLLPDVRKLLQSPTLQK